MQNLKISKEAKDDITVWRNLERYPAWKRVSQLLAERISDADKVINTVGFDRELMFSERDVAIIKKQAYTELINFPAEMIRMLTGTGTEPTENDDPYEDLYEEDSF